jgi:hypothetical protein
MAADTRCNWSPVTMSAPWPRWLSTTPPPSPNRPSWPTTTWPWPRWPRPSPGSSAGPSRRGHAAGERGPVRPRPGHPGGAWLDREGYWADTRCLPPAATRDAHLDAWLRCIRWATDTTWHMEPEKNMADDREQEALTLSCLRLARVEVAIQSYALFRRYMARCDDLLGLSAGEDAGQSGCRDLNGTGHADLIPDWDEVKRTNTRTVIAVSAGYGVVVGLPGLEPGTSSLSATEGSALCGPPFPQVAGERHGPRDAFLAASCQAVQAARTPAPSQS